MIEARGMHRGRVRHFGGRVGPVIRPPARERCRAQSRPGGAGRRGMRGFRVLLRATGRERTRLHTLSPIVFMPPPGVVG